MNKFCVGENPLSKNKEFVSFAYCASFGLGKGCLFWSSAERACVHPDFKSGGELLLYDDK